MRAFLLAVLAVCIVAAGAGFLLETFASRSADTVFATSSARVGPSIEERRFSG